MEESAKILECATTKFDYDRWSYSLRDHPDREKVQAFLHGIKYGEPIGFKGDDMETVWAPEHQLRADYAAAVEKSIAKLLDEGKVIGPFEEPIFPGSRISPLTVVEKNGKLRVCHDLSEPVGNSVNDHIDKKDWPVVFDGFGVAAASILRTGPGTYMAKADWKAAYEQIFVRPTEIRFLGFSWRGKVYYRVVLAFGLRSSAAIHGRAAELLEWIIVNEVPGIDASHWADDHFFNVGLVQPKAHEMVGQVLAIATKHGVTFCPEKIEGPERLMKYVGLFLDGVFLVVYIPEEKIEEAIKELKAMLAATKVTVVDLQRAGGRMNFFTTVVPAGRTFTGRMLSLLRYQERKRISKKRRRMQHTFVLTNEARKDIQWWIDFLPIYNGKSLLADVVGSGEVVHIE